MKDSRSTQPKMQKGPQATYETFVRLRAEYAGRLTTSTTEADRRLLKGAIDSIDQILKSLKTKSAKQKNTSATRLIDTLSDRARVMAKLARRTAEVSIKLFDLIEPSDLDDEPFSVFPEKIGVLLAAEDLLRAAGDFPGSKRPKGWRKAVEGFGRRTEDKMYTLRVLPSGGYWLVMRRAGRSTMELEYLALAYEELPFCTSTDQEAMRLADYCYPDPGRTVWGCWVPLFGR
jgi:hypothetical protein